MQKRRSPETDIRIFQGLQGAVALELIMLSLYRWADVSWLIYPIIINFVFMMIVAALMAPRMLAAVFGAIGAALACVLVLIGLPVLVLANSDMADKPNPFIVFLFIGWIVVTFVVMTLVYLKTEKYLIKRLKVQK